MCRLRKVAAWESWFSEKFARGYLNKTSRFLLANAGLATLLLRPAHARQRRAVLSTVLACLCHVYCRTFGAQKTGPQKGSCPTLFPFPLIPPPLCIPLPSVSWLKSSKLGRTLGCPPRTRSDAHQQLRPKEKTPHLAACSGSADAGVGKEGRGAGQKVCFAGRNWAGELGRAEDLGATTWERGQIVQWEETKEGVGAQQHVKFLH